LIRRNSNLFGPIHHHNEFEMKQISCALTADFWTLNFNLRVFTSKSGERCRNHNSLYMFLPLFKGPKVMGSINNHKLNFHFLTLGCKSFAVNYSLKSGAHRHQQMLDFSPVIVHLHCEASSNEF